MASDGCDFASGAPEIGPHAMPSRTVFRRMRHNVTRLDRRSGRVGDNPITALGLGGIERLIGLLEQLFGRFGTTRGA
ncbi:hypothetical protein NCHU2750_13050 [Neorhizobium sp. NCHU2750]|nr:hypothetical protein NCHU2750_13050 [Neorhizobium sp. NCHU2750]